MSEKLPIRHLVSWSGGNDSTVMLHYLLNKVFDEDTDYRVFFMDTTITFKESIQYVKDLAKLWDFEDRLDIMRPEKTFFEKLRENRFWPSIHRLWCRSYLKDQVMKKYYMKQYRGKRKKLIAHIGVSIHDSAKRRDIYRDMPEKDKIRKYGYAIVHLNYPILTWTDFKKDRYRKKHDIPKNPCYDLIDVSGCYVCPFYHLPYYKRLRAVKPKLFWKLYKYEREIGSRISPEFSLHSLATMKPLDTFKEFQTETLISYTEIEDLAPNRLFTI